MILKYFGASAGDSERFLTIQASAGGAAPGGRYRHWDKLRYLPPPGDLTHEEWWLGIKLARQPMWRPFPLRDGGGRKFKFAMPDIAAEMVHHIDKEASGTIQAMEPLANEGTRDRYLISSLMEEAITSSQLEGAATTRKVAKEMLRSGRKPRNKSEQMILNNFRAMLKIADLGGAPLTPDHVFELHGILTERTLDDPGAVGRFRRHGESIRVEDETGQVLHLPPQAEELKERMNAMCRFANEGLGDAFIHPVAKAVLLHFWLAYDHPFVDGNGRTARSLFYWSMARDGYWLIAFTSISRLLKAERVGYARAFLYSETDENDATYFLLHQCGIIRRAISELHSYLARKTREVHRGRELLRQSSAARLDLNSRQVAVLRYALDHPGTQFSIKVHQDYHHTSYQTARTDLLGLAKQDLLIKGRVGREFVFFAPGDLAERLENPE